MALTYDFTEPHYDLTCPNCCHTFGYKAEKVKDGAIARLWYSCPVCGEGNVYRLEEEKYISYNDRIAMAQALGM